MHIVVFMPLTSPVRTAGSRAFDICVVIDEIDES
jgi:hypothetical protein